MLDSITKALTIQISADDLTGGAWGSIGKNIKGVQNDVVALNQAWELAGRFYDTFVGVLSTPIEALSEGGSFAEAKAGVDALALAYGTNADAMTGDIRRITEGNLSLQQSVQAAGDAIKKGFSPDQTNAIFQWAQKYTDVFGGEVLQVAQQVQDAIYTGKGKGVKAFGLDIQEGMAVVDIMRQINDQAGKLGEGVFNFGDSWKQINTSIADAALELKKQFNDMFGGAGFDGLAQGIISAFRSIEAEAENIAAGIFYPLMDAAKFAWAPVKVIIDQVTEWIDLTFDNSNTVGERIVMVIQTIGNTFYDVARQSALVWKMVLIPIDETVKALASNFNELVDMATIAAKISSYLGGGINPEWVESLKKEAATFKEIKKTGLFGFDMGELDTAQNNFNQKIKEIQFSQKELKKATDDSAGSIKKAGEAFADTSKKAKEHKDAVKDAADQYKAVSGAYKDVSKSMADTAEAISKVMTEEQKGINQTAGVIAGLDLSSFNDRAKKTELERLMTRQENEKAKERDIIEKQSQAQIELARALDKYSTAPKKVEFVSPENPNTTEAIVKSIVDLLVKQAQLEGTMVQA